jgi:hypothetical protein
MKIKFSIPTVAITAFLVLSHSAIASAEVYKTSKDQVVITGLTARQKYPIKAVNAKNKPVSRKDAEANTCGEALINGAAKYKSLVVGTETIDPARLSIKAHPRCNGRKKTTIVTTKKETVKSPTVTKTVTPAITVPVTVPSVTPVPR